MFHSFARMKKYILLLPIVLIGLHMNAQTLSKHQWKNRLLIICDNSEDRSKMIEQLDILQADTTGLQDRNLLVYQYSDLGYQLGLQNPEDCTPGSPEAFKKYCDTRNFSVHLIGLDGGTKLSTNTPISLETLFTMIDGMPMRRAERRRKSGN